MKFPDHGDNFVCAGDVAGAVLGAVTSAHIKHLAVKADEHLDAGQVARARACLRQMKTALEKIGGQP